MATATSKQDLALHLAVSAHPNEPWIDSPKIVIAQRVFMRKHSKGVLAKMVRKEQAEAA